MRLPFFARSERCAGRTRPVRLSAVGGRGMAGEAVARMSIVIRVSAVAGVFLLAGCASWTPSWDWVPSMPGLSGGANVSLTIESDPPGADAKTSVGPSCRTPCMIPVPGDREFTVSYSLNGYLPQMIAVTPRVADNPRPDPEVGGAVASVDVTPNPVYAQLQPAPPPPQSKKGRGRAPKKKQ